MSSSQFQRARSAQAKRARAEAILDAAAEIGARLGVRGVTLGDIALGAGTHKSSVLRYFETREEVFLRLAARSWTEWCRSVLRGIERARHACPPDAPVEDIAAVVAAVLTDTLLAQPLFCDLLAHSPLNLERNVSFEAVRVYKLHVLEETGRLSGALCAILPLTEGEASDVIATIAALAGSLSQEALASPTHQSMADVLDSRGVGGHLRSIVAAVTTGFTLGQRTDDRP